MSEAERSRDRAAAAAKTLDIYRIVRPGSSPRCPTAGFIARYSTAAGERLEARRLTVVQERMACRRWRLDARERFTPSGRVGRRRINQDRRLCEWLRTLPLFPGPRFHSVALARCYKTLQGAETLRVAHNAPPISRRLPREPRATRATSSRPGNCRRIDNRRSGRVTRFFCSILLLRSRSIARECSEFALIPRGRECPAETAVKAD